MPVEGVILGCGSSSGVPRVGLDGPDWGACDPAEPRNRRTRCSMLVKTPQGNLLIDTSPNLREQLLAAGTGRMDAVLFTHDHADQIHGIDDLRAVAYANRRRMPVYADNDTMMTLERRFGYCFHTPPGSGYPPILEARLIADPLTPFVVPASRGAIPVVPFAQVHGPIRSLGFRIGPLAYSSDVSDLDDAAFAVLSGVECWVVDALRDAPHPTHSHVAQTLEWIARVRPKRAILTNLHIDLDYAELSRRLPPGVEVAFDGLSFACAM
jgi:phosphoribosyl 1,2-cyclic phosphate phosphodiesterase